MSSRAATCCSAMGRKPAVSDLGLEAAGIRHDERGIKVGRGLKTSNRRVFAIGEAAGGAPYAQVGRLPRRHRRPPRAVPCSGACRCRA